MISRNTPPTSVLPHRENPGRAGVYELPDSAEIYQVRAETDIPVSVILFPGA